MISHQPQFTLFAAAGTVLSAAVRLVRNRRALRDLDAAQMLDAGITPDALRAVTDWCFWRRAFVAVDAPSTAAVAATDAHDVLAGLAAKAAGAANEANAGSPRARVLRQAAHTGAGQRAAITLQSAA